MDILYLLLPVSLLIFALAIAAFFWAMSSNQFEDLDRQAYSILHDCTPKTDKTVQKQNND
ncbi:MAG: cbb3-type cytochrome oxidase assembly protein CcoS [Gammaproteobacteria bacterium]|nr:MAG: cbb3-type cytochrome oxidase assembly protein CcoS [Gammaproteobacteria bacterium]